jgi:hypothetical protein
LKDELLAPHSLNSLDKKPKKQKDEKTITVRFFFFRSLSLDALALGVCLPFLKLIPEKEIKENILTKTNIFCPFNFIPF